MPGGPGRRSLVGGLVALAGTAALSAAMVPLRTHLAIATCALVLIVPVVAGVAIGGFGAGVFAVVVGFLAYDFFFIPPYGTLYVGAAQNWVALVVYAAVMLLVARLVAFLQRERARAARREDDARRLYELSDALIGSTGLGELLGLVVSTIEEAFRPRWVSLLLPEGTVLKVAATAGDPGPGELDAVTDDGGVHRLATTAEPSDGVVRVALSATGRPVGVLLLSDVHLDEPARFLLMTYANQAAMAIERSRLRDQAVRSELLEEVDRWRRALVGAVSHDLRTPLATITTAADTLRQSWAALDTTDREELLELVESQSDHLDRLVSNLLDMTRIEAGTLELQRAACPVTDVVEGALAVLDATTVAARVRVALPADLAPVEVDQLLMSQVVANLVDNALRYAPASTPVEVTAAQHDRVVEVTVLDHGPGIPPEDRERVFQMYNRVSGGGRAGLGLTISKAFVEAHGETLCVDDAPGGGARFVLTMPTTPVPAEVG
ncbi:MAG TPA: ATP-binding protein [Acidimicrobiales bacterium]|nr:ATP-binding protein [Acidimicrobiales bacterium]